MSTRANVVLTETHVWEEKSYTENLIFYKHSDGYPEGMMPTLEKFTDLMKDGVIRDNISQAGGWLIVLGAIEYQTLKEGLFPESGKPSYEQDNVKVIEILETFIPNDWKVGSYEPTTRIHGDIEYLYVIDMKEKEIKVYSVYSEEKKFNKALKELGLENNQ